jgi:L-asparaginase II
VHRVHVAVSDADGRVIASAGDPALVTFWRSGAKPFQAMPLIEDGVVKHFGLTAEEIALTCASHSSEQGQVQLVRGFLAKIGCAESDLACGPHAPLSPTVARDYEQRGVKLTSVYSNCSGKHTGMLALAKHHGWPTANYQRAGHPVQERCLQSVAEWTDLKPRTIATGVDGCGVVCFALPLGDMARAYARLTGVALPRGGAPGNPGAGSREPGAVLQAMLGHPELIAGEGRPCTEIMRAHSGKLVLKVGAAGVYSAGVLPDGYGIAIKVEDGEGRAATVAMASVLLELGYDGEPVERWARQEAKNTRGEVVGEMRVEGTLARKKGNARARRRA